ncbi:hypothetical protein JTB14_026605 [Gonioctena quinquepunctata]|nr:hypothetical protein JTB14_026605 [Gonioctena quinquepunctata]
MMANNLFRQPKKASEYCVVCSHNSKKNPQYSYFRFPKDEARCNEWKLTLEIVKLDSLTAEQCYKRFRVCSAHFENHMFSSIQKNKLKRNAVPTIFVNAQHSTREDEAASGISGICMQTSSGWESVPSTSFDGPNSKSAPGTSITEYNPEEVSTQTPTSLSKNTTRKVHLRNKIRVLQRKSKEQNTPSKGQISREEVVEYVRQNSSPALASFLETQLKLFGKSPKGLRFRLAPKLTDNHLFPNNFQKMKVKLAIQVFSSTVAAGLNAHISFGNISAEAVHKVSFIENMDKLFDLFNSSKFGKVKDFNRPFMGSEEQIEFLEKNKTMFREMRVLTGNKKDVTNRMKFIKAWQITISAILSLWPILKEKGLNKLFTRRLNQDCLENFFGKIRQQSGNCKNPTPIQFQRGFKKLFALGYFEQTEGTNCLEEFDEILTHITNFNWIYLRKMLLHMSVDISLKNVWISINAIYVWNLEKRTMSSIWKIFIRISEHIQILNRIHLETYSVPNTFYSVC